MFIWVAVFGHHGTLARAEKNHVCDDELVFSLKCYRCFFHVNSWTCEIHQYNSDHFFKHLKLFLLPQCPLELCLSSSAKVSWNLKVIFVVITAVSSMVVSCTDGSSSLVLYVPLIKVLPTNPDEGTGGLASFSFENLMYSTSEPLSHSALGAHPDRN